MYDGPKDVGAMVRIECRGPVDRLREQLADAKERVARLESVLAKIEANPQVADLLNEIGKVL